MRRCGCCVGASVRWRGALAWCGALARCWGNALLLRVWRKLVALPPRACPDSNGFGIAITARHGFEWIRHRSRACRLVLARARAGSRAVVVGVVVLKVVSKFK